MQQLYLPTDFNDRLISYYNERVRALHAADGIARRIFATTDGRSPWRCHGNAIAHKGIAAANHHGALIMWHSEGRAAAKRACPFPFWHTTFLYGSSIGDFVGQSFRLFIYVLKIFPLALAKIEAARTGHLSVSHPILAFDNIALTKELRGTLYTIRMAQLQADSFEMRYFASSDKSSSFRNRMRSQSPSTRFFTVMKYLLALSSHPRQTRWPLSSL